MSVHVVLCRMELDNLKVASRIECLKNELVFISKRLEIVASSSFAQLQLNTRERVELRLLTVVQPAGDVVTSVASCHDDGRYRHRCRYCRKGFHGDSALQIHIRSHTG